jgi:hypothetical protein
MQMIHEQMMGLGQDLTSVFSRAIGDGFEQGAKRGLQSLALGLLDIVQNVFLKRMADGLGNILSGVGTGGKGGGVGGILSGIIGIFGGAVGGGGGKGIDFGIGGGWAKGGVVPGDYKGYDSVPAMLTPGETVIPRGGSLSGGQTVNNFHLHMAPAPRGNVSSKKSQRQQMEQAMAMLRGAQT